MKSLSKINNIKAFIGHNMTYLIILSESNGKSAVNTGRNITVLYQHLEIIGAPTTLTTSGQRSSNFGPSYSINNDAETIQPVISALRI